MAHDGFPKGCHQPPRDANRPEIAQLKQKTITRQGVNIAMLSHGLLSGEELSQFLNRSVEIMTGKEKTSEK